MGLGDAVGRRRLGGTARGPAFAQFPVRRAQGGSGRGRRRAAQGARRVGRRGGRRAQRAHGRPRAGEGARRRRTHARGRWEIRLQRWRRMASVREITRSGRGFDRDTSLYMTNADCLALLMGDDPPQEIENLLYRFLTSLFRRRLGILAAQGEGL